ncbi:hypothetical protein V1504DRAFT_462085, partial [Lipomyces starkeyi]
FLPLTLQLLFQVLQPLHHLLLFFTSSISGAASVEPTIAPAMPTLFSGRPRCPHQAPSYLDTAVAAPVPGATDPPIPKYKLPRYELTVSELYRVWYTGSAAFPSIVSLDEDYGAAWRSGDRQYYSVRLQIIKKVDRLAAARSISKGDAVLHLDRERREKNWTLNMLSNEIRKRNQT